MVSANIATMIITIVVFKRKMELSNIKKQKISNVMESRWSPQQMITLSMNKFKGEKQ